VFTQPRHARGFFEALVADNLDIGRPEQVELIFGRRTRGAIPPAAFKTKVVTRGVDVTVNAFYKHSRIKQYLNDGRALRIETVINDPYDLMGLVGPGCARLGAGSGRRVSTLQTGASNPKVRSCARRS
jgi:hypothetical protein